MIQSAYVLSKGVANYSAKNTRKKIEITATSLADNVLILGFNSVEGHSITSASSPKSMKFDGSEPMSFGAFLKIAVLNATTGQYLIGPEDSNDTSESQNAAATLSILFGDAEPSGAIEPIYDMPDQEGFWTGYLHEDPGYYLDLKALAEGKQYCQVMVDALSENIGLLEGNVFIHIIIPGPVTYLIYANESGQSSSSANGEPFANIQNSNIYLDLQEIPEAYLFAMIGVSGTNPWQFTVGDPKTDAGVGASEV